jgi:hypothetical protein
MPIAVASPSARESLADAPLDQVRRLRWGFWMVLACLPLLPLPWMAAASTRGAPAASHGMVVVSVAWVVAVWFMTPALDVPAGVERGFAPGSRLRWTARLLQLGWPLAYFMLSVALAKPLPAAMITLPVAAGIAVGVVTGLAGIVTLSVLLGRLAEWCRDEFAERLFNVAVWGLVVCSFGLVLAALTRIMQLLACSFGVLWLAGLGSFFLGVLSLTRSVHWSVLHAKHREARSRALAAKMAARGEDDRPPDWVPADEEIPVVPGEP